MIWTGLSPRLHRSNEKSPIVHSCPTNTFYIHQTIPTYLGNFYNYPTASTSWLRMFPQLQCTRWHKSSKWNLILVGWCIRCQYFTYFVCMRFRISAPSHRSLIFILSTSFRARRVGYTKRDGGGANLTFCDIPFHVVEITSTVAAWDSI